MKRILVSGAVLTAIVIVLVAYTVDYLSEPLILKTLTPSQNAYIFSYSSDLEDFEKELFENVDEFANKYIDKEIWIASDEGVEVDEVTDKKILFSRGELYVKELVLHRIVNLIYETEVYYRCEMNDQILDSEFMNGDKVQFKGHLDDFTFLNGEHNSPPNKLTFIMSECKIVNLN
jgi:predicted AlkP superfamily pyrophosphatase or phosphodiesterase